MGHSAYPPWYELGTLWSDNIFYVMVVEQGRWKYKFFAISAQDVFKVFKKPVVVNRSTHEQAKKTPKSDAKK